MLDLLLSEPKWNQQSQTDSAKLRVSLLNKLESVIWALMSRSEARLWLCNTIATITSVTPHHQRDLFMTLLKSKNKNKKRFASQLLELLFDTSPRKPASILANTSYAFARKFFQGNPTRISQWFSKTGYGLGQGKGGSALSQFAFAYRDSCWEELEWKGKHGQSPAVVATKPHYFLDLDIQKTVENFLDNVPEFWSSHEFSESLKDGEILFIDRSFFVQYFLDLMYKEDCSDVWDVLSEFLEDARFSSLCKHLLITLEELDLRDFLKMLHKHLKPRVEHKDPMDSSYFFEVVLSKCSECESFDQILLFNAVCNYGRQLLRLIRDEGEHEEQVKLEDIVSEICAIPGNDNSWAPIVKMCSEMKTTEAFKLMGLQSWVFFVSLSEKCQTIQCWESLFLENAISFRKDEKYSILSVDGESEESEADMDRRSSKKVKPRKKDRHTRKRRRGFNHDDNGLLDFDTTNNMLDLQSTMGSWLLSVDGYSASWSIVLLVYMVGVGLCTVGVMNIIGSITPSILLVNCELLDIDLNKILLNVQQNEFV